MLSGNRRHLKILVIEHNPLFSDGTRLSDLLGMTDRIKASVEELYEDVKYGSHGLVTMETAAWETVDGFPLHTVEFRLSSGPSHALDEETLRRLYENGWYGWWSSEWFTREICPENVGFSFDYAHLLSEHDIPARRRKGEFDMVFLVNLDPVWTFEAMMIGNNPFWINGDPMEADCPNTAVMNVSVSRRDANFECFGHMMENIMMHVFTGGTDCSGYPEGEWNGIPYEKLNLWQKFSLAKRNYDGTAACGNVHFSPNSLSDYDWKNPEPVLSTWRDWLENYPDLTGDAELFDPSAYIPGGLNCEKHACRLHHRWWFSCMPHAAGFTPDGYSNSWWDYFAPLDYVEETRAEEDGSFTFLYRSGKTESFRPDPVPAGEECTLYADVPGCAVRYTKDAVTVSKDGKTASVPRTGC
jgi:hypothetical protein